MKVGGLLAHLEVLELALAVELRRAAERHRDDHDVDHQCRAFARNAEARARALEPLARRCGGKADWTTAIQKGSHDLLEELRTLVLRHQEVILTWTMAMQAAKAIRDAELLAYATSSAAEATAEADWFLTRIKTGAPQALTVGQARRGA